MTSEQLQSAVRSAIRRDFGGSRRAPTRFPYMCSHYIERQARVCERRAQFIKVVSYADSSVYPIGQKPAGSGGFGLCWQHAGFWRREA